MMKETWPPILTHFILQQVKKIITWTAKALLPSGSRLLRMAEEEGFDRRPAARRTFLALAGGRQQLVVQNVHCG